jgi:imidazoleglycerol phosphate synthase cyclase subunit
MVRPRLIPCLLLKNGLIVRSQAFSIHQMMGNPMSTVERFSHWNVDELVILNISTGEHHDLRRDDLQKRYLGSSILDVLRCVAEVCFMPLAFGGRIRTLEDMRELLENGADKCVLNTAMFQTPELVTQAAKRFGSQCVVASIDALRHPDGRLEAYVGDGKIPTGLTPAQWAKRVEDLGAGEIFLNSIDRDGAAGGYDLDLIRSVTEVTTIPVIACGGVGSYGHFAQGITEAGASAVSAANIFHFFELSYPWAKQACLDAGVPMRSVELNSRWFRREPVYDLAERDKRIADRLDRARKGPGEGPASKKTVFCTKCCYPSASATPLAFDADGVCTGCQVAVTKQDYRPEEWKRRHKLLGDILEKYRCKDGSTYDCVVAVSGGKDSYFITHTIVHEFGLRPLLVTYNGNNWTEAGWRNMLRMKEVFGVDHALYSPSVELLKKLNRLALVIMGDMNWHAHVGINTVPVQAAVQHRAPLVIWGEQGMIETGGMYSMNDFPEMNYRFRLEHFARSYEWNYMVGLEGITEQDMIMYRYPTDQQLFDLDVRGIYTGNYLYWDPNRHTKMVMEKYGWEPSAEPFDRTYRRFSNLDDMHENGLHDYLRYIKFGYGRCTDHVCKDIRSGDIDREQGVALVRKHDEVKPSDLYRWLEYVGMSEEEFDAIADTFRDRRVWTYKDGQWSKDNLWD